MWSYRDNFDYTQYYGSNIKVHVKYDNKNNGVQDNSYIDNENSNENSNENNNIKEYITSGILTNITKSDYGCVSVILKENPDKICRTSISSNLIDKIEIELNENYENEVQHVFKNIPYDCSNFKNKTNEYLPSKKTIII